MSTFSQLARWNRWANRQVLATLDTSGGEPAKALDAFQHVLEAELTWLRRLAGEPTAFVQQWKGSTLANCHAWIDEAHARLGQVIEQATPEWLADGFSYQNSRGEPFTNMREESLMHMLMHSSQYRGEAAGMLNAAGHRVPDLDFGFWLRDGCPD